MFLNSKDTICQEYLYFHKKYKALYIAKKKILAINSVITKRFEDKKFKGDSIEVNDFLYEYVAKKRKRLPPKKKDVPPDIIKPFMKKEVEFKIEGDGINDFDDYENEIKFIWDEDDIETTNKEIQDTYDYLEDIDEDVFNLYNLYKNKMIDFLKEEIDNQYYYEQEDITFELKQIIRDKFDKRTFMKNKELAKKYGVMTSGSNVNVSEY